MFIVFAAGAADGARRRAAARNTPTPVNIAVAALLTASTVLERIIRLIRAVDPRKAPNEIISLDRPVYVRRFALVHYITDE